MELLSHKGSYLKPAITARAAYTRLFGSILEGELLQPVVQTSNLFPQLTLGTSARGDLLLYRGMPFSEV